MILCCGSEQLRRHKRSEGLIQIRRCSEEFENPCEGAYIDIRQKKGRRTLASQWAGQSKERQRNPWKSLKKWEEEDVE